MSRIVLATLIALAFSVSLIGCEGGDEIDSEKLEERPPVPEEKRRPPPGPGTAEAVPGEGEDTSGGE